MKRAAMLALALVACGAEDAPPCECDELVAPEPRPFEETTYMRTALVSPGYMTQGTARASCDAGDRVVTGACYWRSSIADVRQVFSGASGESWVPNAWVCAGWSADKLAEIEAVAFCEVAP